MNDPLLQPFKLRHLTLRNRIMSTAHAPGYVEDAHPRDRYRLYHEEKAKGGVALTVFGGSTMIAPDSPSVFGQPYAGDDSIIPWIGKLTTGVKAHGAAVFCQLTHMGRRVGWDTGHWLPVIGPSSRRERAHRSMPKVMETEDIARVIGQFADAARRCQQGGVDGIEILSHSHLLGQFLSPLVNDRTDDYGGSLENRMRLTHQVIEAIREAVGPDLILGLRVTGDELTPAGLSHDDCVAHAEALAATGSVDFLNVLAGAPYDDLGLAGWVPPMGMPAAAHLDIAGRIREAVDIPVFHAGGIADLATARHAVQAGLVDMVGMTRAQIADPYLVTKLMRGEEDRIRPCVGLGYCVDRVNQGKDALCGHNPATGREARMPHIITAAPGRKRVVIVGGGPGGMEAARVSALRGHEVTLFEATSRLGGQVNLAARGMTRRQIIGVTDWLADEIHRLDVDVRCDHYIDSDEIDAFSADVVILATGGLAVTPGIPGAHLTATVRDVLSGEVRPAGDVLILDEIGDHPACVAADVLASAGCTVTLATPDRSVAQDLGPTNSSVVLRDLVRKGVSMMHLVELVAAKADGNRRIATLRHILGGEESDHLFDHIVVEYATEPDTALFESLRPLSRNMGQLDQAALISGTMPWRDINPGGRFMLARIGDAVAGRNIHAAMFDALRICKDL